MVKKILKTVIIIDHFLIFSFFSTPIAAPAPANASGIVRHAPQKFSFITILLTDFLAQVEMS